jgi:hypothetical protein
MSDKTYSPPTIEEALSDINLRQAQRKVAAYYRTQNYAGSPDGDFLEMTEPYLFEALRAGVMDGTYRFQPLRTYETLKPSGGVRVETISSPMDRLLIQALFNSPGHHIQNRITATATCNNVVLAPAYRFNPPFSRYTYSYWPADYRAYRNTALRIARHYRDGVVLHADIANFYPSIRRDRVRILLRPWFHEKVWPLIDAYLNFRVHPGHPEHLVYDGIPIEEPISRLLANFYLEELDRHVLHELGIPYVRYVDDMMFFLPDRTTAEHVEYRIADFMLDRLGLRLNEKKREIKSTRSLATGDDAQFSRRLSILNAGVGLLGWKAGLRQGLLAAFKELLEEMPSPNAVPDPQNRNQVRGAKFAAWRAARIKARHLIDHITLLLGDARTRMIASIALAHLGTPRAIQALQIWFNSTASELSPHERATLAAALARNGRLHKLPGLDSYATNHPELRAIMCRHARTCKAIAAGIQDRDPLIRRAAVINFILRTRGRKTLLPILLKAAAIEKDRDTLLLFLTAKDNTISQTAKDLLELDVKTRSAEMIEVVQGKSPCHQANGRQPPVKVLPVS